MITGGAGGIGRAVATAFDRAGYRVVLADLDAEALSATARELGVAGLAVDISDEAAVRTVVDQVQSEHGPIQVLVNNAGLLSVHGRLLDLAGADLERILRTNVLGTFLMTRQVAGLMVARGLGGAIVNLSSIGARQPTSGMGGYESSKAAVDAITRWAALELAEHRIRVNAVAPGPVLTDMMATAMPEGSAARTAWTDRIPLRRMAAVEEVAAAVLFLAGDAAAHITGVSLPVDGGQLLV